MKETELIIVHYHQPVVTSYLKLSNVLIV